MNGFLQCNVPRPSVSGPNGLSSCVFPRQSTCELIHFKRADTDSKNYDRWWIERSAFSVTAIQEVVGGFIGTFKESPPRQKPAKFSVDDVMTTMYKTGAH